MKKRYIKIGRSFFQKLTHRNSKLKYGFRFRLVSFHVSINGVTISNLCGRRKTVQNICFP